MTSRKPAKIVDGHYDKALRYFKESDNVYAVPQSSSNVASAPLSRGKRGSSVADGSPSESKRARERTRPAPGSDIYRKGDCTSPGERSSQAHCNAQGSNSNGPSDDGGWSQHVSSSGKVYYYNRRTEKSQWEKPAEMRARESKSMLGRERKHANNNKESKNGEKNLSRTSYRKDSDYSPRPDRTNQKNNLHGHTAPVEMVKSQASCTSASSTTMSRFSSSVTPDGVPSLVQDISPVGSPTSSSISMISPCSNSSPSSGSLNSPMNQMSSPMISGLSLSMLGNPAFLGQVQHENSMAKFASSNAMHADGQFSNKLHPLQQATLLQKQQMLGFSHMMSAKGPVASAGAISYHTDTGQHLSSFNQLNGPQRMSPSAHDIPPPPPPQHSSPRPRYGSHSGMQQADASGGKSCLTMNRSLSDPRVAAMNSELNVAYSRSNSRSASPVPGSMSRSHEAEVAPLPELPSLQSYGQLCLTNFQDFSVGWYGNLFDKQADNALQDTDFVQSIESGKSLSSLLISKSFAGCCCLKMEAGSSRLSCFGEVSAHLTSLQDHRSGS